MTTDSTIDDRLGRLKTLARSQFGGLAAPFPEAALFFSVSDGSDRATVIEATGSSFDTAWSKGQAKLRAVMNARSLEGRWIRVDWVERIDATTWHDLAQLLERTKRNYFRFGLALDSELKVAFTEMELNANAMLYGGNSISNAVINEKNFSAYARSKYPNKPTLRFSGDGAVFLLSTRGVFCDAADEPRELTGVGLEAGRRRVDKLAPDDVETLIQDSSLYLARQVKDTGAFVYGYHPCFDREIDAYNTLRHASTTYSMIEAWEVTRDDRLKAAIDRSLDHLCDRLIKHCRLPDGSEAAFLVDVDGEVKLGGNAVAILALTKYCKVTASEDYLTVAQKLARGVVFMQDGATGSFSHVLNFADLSVRDRFRTIYYDGEAAFGLMRLYEITRELIWLETVEKAFDYFIASRHWEHHDHWLSYCVNELTRYRPEECYFRFGIDNFATYLDFVIERITTFPTLLELMMAAEEMTRRLQDNPGYRHLLDEVDLEKFHRALHTRAHYLLNGHFWPEIAMFFRNPHQIVGSFFIRHHAFRVRIDDVEHYLSGLVAYRRLLLREGASPAPRQLSQPSRLRARPADPRSLGFLMYPDSPTGFREVRTLAEKAASKGLKVYYMSYRSAAIRDGKIEGYAFEHGRWIPASFDIPAIIDNAPPRRRSEVELFSRLASTSFLTCHKLGGKQKTLGLLAADPDARSWLIPFAALSYDRLREAFELDDRVVAKPFRSNRGRGVCLLQKHTDGRVSVRTNDKALQLEASGLENFVAERSNENWMLQKYVRSVDADGRAFDIRVPVFRSADRSWKAGRIYARLGAGGITSNLATGGSTHDAIPFLAQLYDDVIASHLVVALEDAALKMAEVLQRHYPFMIDALGYDFGVAEGRAYLFEVNSYPGIKGCLETATDLKAEYFAGLAAVWRDSGRHPTVNELRRWINAPLPSRSRPERPLRPPFGEIEAATPENQALLHSVIARGENDFSTSPYLRPGIGNPAYRLIAGEARRRRFRSKIVTNTHLEIGDESDILAIFSPNSPNLSFAMRRVTENKEMTRKVLLDAGLPAPVGQAFKDYDEALAFFKSKEHPQVLKPLRGSGGVGVTTGVTTEEQFDRAWERASGGKRSVVVEDLAFGDELRLIVLNGETVAAVCRMPAYVIGDGVRTITELVDDKNKQRKRNPLMRVYPISQFDYLDNELKRPRYSVPESGEFVRLSSVSNVALGGEAVSMTEVLHPSFLELGRRTFEAFPGATQLGLDVIARDFGADAFVRNATIIEVNSDPAIGTPRFAAYGPPAEGIAVKLLDFIGTSRRFQTPRAKLGGAAHLQPAPMYVPDKDHRPFPRTYRLQSRLLRDAAAQRGLGVEILSPDLTVISNADKKTLFCFGIPHTTLLAARRASNDKEHTKRLLRAAGIATPSGEVFPVSEAERAWAFAVETGLPVVVKPLVGSGGKGVFTNITSHEDFGIAWKTAMSAGAISIIVENHLAGNDYRLFVVQDELVAVAHREPAYVLGNGEASILQLIAKKNAARKANPYHGAKPIILTGLMERNLRQLNLSGSSILEPGRRLQLHSIANIGSGGESIDETDRAHPAWAEIAVRARRSIYNPYHAGIDLMAEDISQPPDAQSWSVIEVNTNPDFGVNHFPMKGQGRDVAGALVASIFERPTASARERAAVEA